MDPGWYPDPFSNGGYIRWWDGERWGASTSVETMAPTTERPGDPVQLPPPATMPPPAPAYGRAGGGGDRAPFPLATWGSRAIARILDLIIEGAVSAPIMLWLIWPAWQKVLDALPQDGSAPPESVMVTFQNDLLGQTLALTLVSAVVGFLYEVPQNVTWGRTIGKRVTGIRIRPLVDDVPLTWSQATIRWGTYALGSALTRGWFAVVDGLWPLWDRPWQQAIHDKTARTIVVPTRR